MMKRTHQKVLTEARMKNQPCIARVGYFLRNRTPNITHKEGVYSLSITSTFEELFQIIHAVLQAPKANQDAWW